MLPSPRPIAHLANIPNAPPSSPLAPRRWNDPNLSQNTLQKTRQNAINARTRRSRGFRLARGSEPTPSPEVPQSPTLPTQPSSPILLTPTPRPRVRQPSSSQETDYGNIEIYELPGDLTLPAVDEETWESIQLFQSKLGELSMEECTQCKERWFNMKVSRGICHACTLRDSTQRRGAGPALFSDANNMDPGDMPPNLEPLSALEEMVIARAHVHMQVRRVRGCQYSYSGHCVSFAQNT